MMRGVSSWSSRKCGGLGACEVLVAIPYVLSAGREDQLELWRVGGGDELKQPLYNVVARGRGVDWCKSLLAYCGRSALRVFPARDDGLDVWSWQHHEFGGSYNLEINGERHLALPVSPYVARQVADPERCLALMQAIGLRRAPFERSEPTLQELELLFFAVEGLTAGFRESVGGRVYATHLLPLAMALRKKKEWDRIEALQPWMTRVNPDGSVHIGHDEPLNVPWVNYAKHFLLAPNSVNIPERLTFKLHERDNSGLPVRNARDQVRLPRHIQLKELAIRFLKGIWSAINPPPAIDPPPTSE